MDNFTILLECITVMNKMTHFKYEYENSNFNTNKYTYLFEQYKIFF